MTSEQSEKHTEGCVDDKEYDRIVRRDLISEVKRLTEMHGVVCAENAKLDEARDALRARVAELEYELQAERITPRWEVAEADAAALRAVLEDCHIHNEYVRVSAAHADRLKKLKYYGRAHDRSAAEHETAVGMALSGAAGRMILAELRDHRRQETERRDTPAKCEAVMTGDEGEKYVCSLARDHVSRSRGG